MLKLQDDRKKYRALAFSPDSRRLATIAGREQRVSLWELPSCERTLSPGEADEIQTLTFDPDGSAVILASDRYLRRWDLAAGTIEDKWLRVANYCHRVAFSFDGSLLAAGTYARYGNGDCCRVDLFRIAEFPMKTFLVGDYGTPLCLGFSPDSRFLAMGGDYQRVRVWSMKEKARTVSWKFVSKVHALAFSPDGSIAAVATESALILYDTTTHKPCGSLVGHTGPIHVLCFSRDGTLLSAGADGTARFWDVAARSERAAFDWKVGPIRVGGISLDGMLAAVGGDDGLVVWDLE